MIETVVISEPLTDTVIVQATEVIIETPGAVSVVLVAGELAVVEADPIISVVTLDPETIVVEAAPVTTVIEIGIAGPQGPPGADGAAGTAPQAYTHTQAVPASVWTINHSLGYVPNVTVLNTLGTEVLGAISHPTVNQTVLVFSAAFSGVAYLS